MAPNIITSTEKKKVFVTGSGNIEVTQVSQPISHSSNVVPNVTPNMTSNVSSLGIQILRKNRKNKEKDTIFKKWIRNLLQVIQKPMQQTSSVNVSVQPLHAPTSVHNQLPPNPTPTKPIISQPVIKTEPIPIKNEDDIDVNWLYVCDWRGCQR